MEEVLSIVRSWNEYTQMTVFITLGCAAMLTLFLIVWVVLRTLRIILRGYNVNKIYLPSNVYEIPDCNHNESLTGKCLKGLNGCRTVGECDRVVIEHNQKFE